jgi:hypothetical protein
MVHRSSLGIQLLDEPQYGADFDSAEEVCDLQVPGTRGVGCLGSPGTRDAFGSRGVRPPPTLPDVVAIVTAAIVSRAAVSHSACRKSSPVYLPLWPG